MKKYSVLLVDDEEDVVESKRLIGIASAILWPVMPRTVWKLWK